MTKNNFMEDIKEHGGKRKGSGRKKVSDPKRLITVYINESRIKVLGDQEIKNIAKSAIEGEFIKKLKIT